MAATDFAARQNFSTLGIAIPRIDQFSPTLLLYFCLLLYLSKSFILLQQICAARAAARLDVSKRNFSFVLTRGKEIAVQAYSVKYTSSCFTFTELQLNSVACCFMIHIHNYIHIHKENCSVSVFCQVYILLFYNLWVYIHSKIRILI